MKAVIKEIKYTCPMHPGIVKDAPGKCPICNMDLVPMQKAEQVDHNLHGDQANEQVKKHSEHDHSGMSQISHESGGGHSHHGGMIEDFKKRFYITLILTIPIMALSPMIQHWLKVDWPFTGSTYLLLLLSSVVYFYGGWPFLQGLVQEVKSRSLGMMTLVGVAITVAYAYSVAIV